MRNGLAMMAVPMKIKLDLGNGMKSGEIGKCKLYVWFTTWSSKTGRARITDNKRLELSEGKGNEETAVGRMVIFYLGVPIIIIEPGHVCDGKEFLGVKLFGKSKVAEQEWNYMLD